MKKLLITLVSVVIYIYGYCQSNIPVSYDNECLDRISVTFMRSMIATFGLDTVKTWVDQDLRFSCIIKTDSLGYTQKHLIIPKTNEWFGEYRRKKLERYLVSNKVRFEFCYITEYKSDLERQVEQAKADEMRLYEKNGYSRVFCAFPSVLIHAPIWCDQREYKNLTRFEVLCKRLNIKLEKE